VCLKNSIDKRFTGYFDVVASLQEINTIVLCANTFILHSDTCVDLIDQDICHLWILGGNGKVIYLMTYE